MFAQLRNDLVALLNDLQAAPGKPTGASWKRVISLDQQRQASRWIAESIGYSFQRGRLDETAHPFCTTLGPADCRILTRYLEDNFASGFYSTLHEAAMVYTNRDCPTIGMECHRVCSQFRRSRITISLVGKLHRAQRCLLEMVVFTSSAENSSEAPGKTCQPTICFAMLTWSSHR